MDEYREYVDSREAFLGQFYSECFEEYVEQLMLEAANQELQEQNITADVSPACIR